MKFALALLTTIGIVPATIYAQHATAAPDEESWLTEISARSQEAGEKLAEAQTAFAALQRVIARAQAASGLSAAVAQPTGGPAQVDVEGDGRTNNGPANHDHNHGHHQTSAAPLSPVVTNGIAQLAAVRSKVDVSALLNTGRPIASSGKPDVVGAFRFLCQPSHLGYWDPLMFPGDRTGKSHLHQFFGNTAVDADSTYESLRTTGESTCMNIANRSGYWQPALIQTAANGRDEVVVPEYINIYYKRRPASDPHYTDKRTRPVNHPVNIPRGLRYIFGYPTQKPKFKCVDPRTWKNLTDWSGNMGEVLARCPAGAELDATIHSPPCWDGKNLDSADHRSHMAYQVSNASTGHTYRCPASHPYEIATFTLQAMYKVLPTDRVQTWRFSSDAMMAPGKRAGSSFHADWFGAWEDSVLETWQEWCINKLLSCSGGNLGNGSSLHESDLHKELKQQSGRRVPVPAIS